MKGIGGYDSPSRNPAHAHRGLMPDVGSAGNPPRDVHLESRLPGQREVQCGRHPGIGRLQGLRGHSRCCRRARAGRDDVSTVPVRSEVGEQPRIKGTVASSPGDVIIGAKPDHQRTLSALLESIPGERHGMRQRDRQHKAERELERRAERSDRTFNSAEELTQRSPRPRSLPATAQPRRTRTFPARRTLGACRNFNLGPAQKLGQTQFFIYKVPFT